MTEQKLVYKYHFDVDNVIVETGVTDDLTRRHRELREEYPGAYRYILPIDSKPITLEEGLKWLDEMDTDEWPVKYPERLEVRKN